MIPADLFLILYTGIDIVADHKVVVPGLLAVYPGGVGNDHHVIAAVCQIVCKIDHCFSVVDSLLGTFLVHNRAYRKPDQFVFHFRSEKRIRFNCRFHSLCDSLVILHRKCTVRAELNVFRYTDTLQVLKCSLSACTDELHFRKYPLCKKPVPGIFKGSQRLGILDHRHLHKHGNGHCHEGIGVHDKASAVYKRDTSLVYNKICLAVCAQDLIFAQKALHAGDPAERGIQYRHRKSDEQQPLGLAGHDLNKIVGYLPAVLSGINRHEPDIKPAPVPFMKLLYRALEHCRCTLVSAVTGCGNGDIDISHHK